LPTFTLIQKDPVPPGTIFETAPISAPSAGTQLVSTKQWNNLIDILEGTVSEKVDRDALELGAANQLMIMNAGATAWAFGTVADANISSHTSTKITITAKGQLNSNIVYIDQANTFGDFDQTFKDNRILIESPDGLTPVTIINAQQTLARNLTIPILTGNRSFVVTGEANQIGDAEISTHTTTKISTTSKSLLNSAIVYNDQANIFGDFDQTFKDDRIRIENPAGTFEYQITAGAIGADRILNLPVITGTDTVAVLLLAQTLENKTLGTGTVFSVIPTINDGITFTFNPNATVTGVNVGAHTANPSTPLDGDVVYNSTSALFQFREAGTWKSLAGGAGDNLGNHTATQDLLMATFDIQNVLSIQDSSANEQIIFASVASAVNEITITNAATGNPAIIAASGEANASILLKGKGTGTILIADQTTDTKRVTFDIAGATASTKTTLDFNQTVDRVITFPNAAGTVIITGLANQVTDTEIAAHTSTKITITAKGQLNSNIVYTDQANIMGDFDFTLKDNRLRLENPAGTFEVGFLTSAEVADRILTIPLLGADRTIVVTGLANQIGDAEISAHTSTKITITAKGQLNSSIVYTDQANVMGDFDQTFKDDRLRIENPAGTFEVQFLTSAEAADRILTIPLLGGNRSIIVTGVANQITDTEVSSHTSTKITITAKGQLNSAIVYNDQTNAFGDFEQSFKDNQLKIFNPADTFKYVITGGAIAAERIANLPVLLGTDTFAFAGFANAWGTVNQNIAATGKWQEGGVSISPIGLHDVFVRADGMYPRTTAGCAAIAKLEFATSLANVQVLDFDQTTQEFAQFTTNLPRNWNNGTITVTVYWTATAGTGAVVWGISGGAYSNDDALTVALGTAQTVTDTLIATSDLHISPRSSAITLAGTPADADFLVIQISRDPVDAGDTLTGDARLIGVSIEFTLDAAVAS